VAEAAVILTVSISLFLVSPILFVAMGTLLCSVSFATQRLILRRASEEAKISMNHTLNSQRLADEGFRNFRQISTGGNRKGFSSQFFTQRWLGALHNAKYTSLQSLPRYIVEIAVISSVALIGLMQLMFGFEVVPALSIGMFLAGLFRLMSALVPLQGSLGVLARSIPESELARDFLFAAIENRKEDALAEISSAQVENPVIKFSNVSFSYPLAEVETLRDVNFEISFGQLIFLSGKSGAGKSTLVDLLLGLRHPTKGCVTIGGVEASSFPSKAYVPQATALIAGTLAQNISFDFGESMSSERWSKVVSVVELLGLTNLVERTPAGLNGLVGEGGISLSGGETQRVGIARSLIDNPKIIVFDEVTSALDSETAEVFRTIINRLRGNVTILVITHGETSGYDFDGELKILDGCVTQIGRMKHT
jgi:ABC-type bacteriocin/lantibiotic exporter with double-glycine peptidase domain